MMLNNGSYYGLWWLIGNEQRRINGTLHFDSQGKSILHTLDHFENDDIKRFNDFPNYKCIIGIASSIESGNDYSFKLFDVFQTRRTTQVLDKNRYTSELTLIGSVDSNDNSDRFNYLMLSSPRFEKWVEPTGFKKNDPVTNEVEFGFKYTYLQPTPIKLYENEKLESYLFFRAKIDYRSRREILLKEIPFINFKYKQAIDITVALQMKTNIERLFSILWEESSFFNAFDLKSIANNDFRVYGVEVPEIVSLKTGISFNDFLSKAEIIFENWFLLHEELNLLISTFFSAFSSKITTLEDRFLSYCFSLEVYHRIRIKNKEPLKDSDKRMYEKAQSEIKSGDALSWFKTILNKDKDIRFGIRLTSLLENSFSSNKINNQQEFISKVVSTRNYHVHLDNSLENQIFNNEELIEANQILSSLMIELLKKEIKL